MKNLNWMIIGIMALALGIGTACGGDDDDNDNDNDDNDNDDGTTDADTDADADADTDTDTDTDTDADTDADTDSTGWTCDPDYYGVDDGCDCGCTVADPDCGSGGCTEPGCTDETCDYCYDSEGEEIPCAEVPDEWTCDPFFYGDGECDCGCSVADPDCGSGGCTEPDCIDATCDYCWGEVNDGECGGE